MNPAGAHHPVAFKSETRRAEDGAVYIGQNKYDSKGRQINDLVIEFKHNNGISKTCPDRLRGQHAKIYYDLQESCYKIQDLGIGLGTFLKCDNSFMKNGDTASI